MDCLVSVSKSNSLLLGQVVMPRCELSPVSYCRLVVVRAMSGLNADQDKLTYADISFFGLYIYIYM